MSQRIRISSDRVIHETVDDEVIILNLDTGMYYSTRNVGAEIWQLVLRDSSIEAIVDGMLQRYRGTRDAIETAVRSFLGELVGEALVLADSLLPTPAVATAMSMSRTDLPFSWPRLDRHSDLKRFLLLYI